MKRNYSVKLARINSQGYVDGQYFGANFCDFDGNIMRLYEVRDSDGFTVGYHRCASRKDALLRAAELIARSTQRRSQGMRSDSDITRTARASGPC